MPEITYNRILNLSELLALKSHFLFGPRSTGKSTLIHKQLSKDAVVFDLLERDTYRRLVHDPSLLSKVDQSKLIVVDEIQKIPTLLDEVHRLIQKNKTTFLLTGSSARKLKRGSANLLAGRAWQASMYPLVSREIPDFNLNQYLLRGGLPEVYNSEQWKRELRSYVSLYLREEIAAEALTRNIEAFSEFLDLAARSNGEEVNYQSFARDCATSVNTMKNYFQILEDTLVGFSLKAFKKTKKRKAISRSKHYFFDTGVVNSLCDVESVSSKTQHYGKLFEHFIIQEVRAANSYLLKDSELNYWRAVSKQEVDLIYGERIAIEIKSTTKVQDKHLKGLRALKEENLLQQYYLISQDEFEYTTDDQILCLHWKTFLDRLWSGHLL